MNRASIMRIATLVLLAIGPLAANAGSISGTVLNHSAWTNDATPGDGTGQGSIIVGAWSSDIVGPATESTNITGRIALPISLGPRVYSFGGSLTDSTYSVFAWIDGNTNSMYDIGEPRSAAQSVVLTLSNNVAAGINFDIVDDSDDDDVPDYWEARYFGSLDEPGDGDKDLDGLINSTELKFGTSPTHFDTDGDGMDDAWEHTYYLMYTKAAESSTSDDPAYPLRALISPRVYDAMSDADGDGLPNIVEYRGADGHGILEQDPDEATGVPRSNPLNSGDQMNPLNVDTDNDSLLDCFEAAWYDPVNGISPHTAGDPAADPDNDGLTNFREQCLLPILREYGTNDIWSLGPESSNLINRADGGCVFEQEISFGVMTNTIKASRMALRAADWTKPTQLDGFSKLPQLDYYGYDTDDDRLPDGWEVEFNLDPRSGDDGTNGYWDDPDGDGLINMQEYLGQDGIPDSGDETNPNEHNWRPLTSGGNTGLRRPRVIDEYWTLTRESPSSGTVGGALPTWSLGYDPGTDTDDDGIPDHTEMRREYPPGSGLAGCSPVHSMAPFVQRAALITSPAGIPIPDPEYLTRGYNPQLHDADWTVECYVNLGGTNLTGKLIHYPKQSKNAYLLGLSNNVPYITFDTLGVSDYTYTVWGMTLPTNRWIHLAATWNSGLNSLALYIDGIFCQAQRIYEQDISSVYYASAIQPRLGSSADSSFVNRLYIDEVRIWANARTAEQIEEYRGRLVPQSNAYLRTVCRFQTNANLVAYYRFDDGGEKAEDFARKAKNSLLTRASEDYTFGDFGYALSTGTVFKFVTDAAPVRGVMPLGADDADGDRLPDDWEMINHLDPKSASSPYGASDDAEDIPDLLSNLYEFLAQTNPRDFDSNQDGSPDFNEDLDQDGLVNILEQDNESRPDIVDTDDDGLTDNQEQEGGTDPANALDPAVSRALHFNGTAADYLEVPIAWNQRLTSWTLEAWVKPDTTTGNNGSILRRTVQKLTNGTYAMNYVIGFTNSAGLRPYTGFVTPAGATNFVIGPVVPTGIWVHIASTFDLNNSVLRLYTNGILAAARSNLYSTPPMNGKGGDTFVRIGEGFQGYIDEVRLWSTARAATQVRSSYDRSIGVDGMSGMVHYFPFDDSQASSSPIAFNTFHQPQGYQDFVYPTDWDEQWRHSARPIGTLAEVTPGAFVPPPSIRILLEPSDSVAAGAMWSLDGEWYASGVTVTTSDGEHMISYKTIDGWSAIPTETLTLTNGIATTLTRTYLPKASLRVNLLPPEAVTDGAQWRVDGDSWQITGTTLTDLDAGDHTLECSTISGWLTPATETLTLVGGVTQIVAKTYTRPTLTVVLAPNAAITDGAMWSLDGGAWTNSGISAEVAAGNHTVGFLDVDGWLAPSNLVITLTNTASTTVTGLYHSLEIYGGAGSTTGLFRRPYSAVLSPTREIYVSDSDNHRIQKFSPTNGAWTVLGAGTNSTKVPSGTQAWFNQPSGICLDNSGNLYVADQGNNRIQKRNATNGTWTIIGGNTNGVASSTVGKFNTPIDVAVDSATNVYVADLLNNRVQRLSNNVWSVFIAAGPTDGFVLSPRGLTIGISNSLAVSDDGTSPAGQQRVQRFASSGALIERLGSSQASQGGLLRPSGMTYSPANTLFLADCDNNRVLWSGTPRNWEMLAVTNGTFLHPNDAAWDPRGRLVITDTDHNRIVEVGVTDADFPTNAATILPTSSGPTNILQWFGTQGWLYDLQYKTNLLVIPWSPVGNASGLLGSNSTITVFDVVGATSRFYRVVFY